MTGPHGPCGSGGADEQRGGAESKGQARGRGERRADGQSSRERGREREGGGAGAGSGPAAQQRQRRGGSGRQGAGRAGHLFRGRAGRRKSFCALPARCLTHARPRATWVRRGPCSPMLGPRWPGLDRSGPGHPSPSWHSPVLAVLFCHSLFFWGFDRPEQGVSQKEEHLSHALPKTVRGRTDCKVSYGERPRRGPRRLPRGGSCPGPHGAQELSFALDGWPWVGKPRPPRTQSHPDWTPDTPKGRNPPPFPLQRKRRLP